MIEISDFAATHIQDMLDQNDMQNLYLRVGVEDGGCSGLSYSMRFDDTLLEEDRILEQNGIKMLIDAESEPYLVGVKIDYKLQGMTGGFTIDNPNAKFSCGCGASFRTATYKGTPKKC